MRTAARSFDRFRRFLKGLGLGRLARMTGFARRRERKVSPPALAWAAILGAASGPTRGVTDIATAAGAYTGTPVSRQAVHQRLASAGAVAFFAAVCLALGRRLAGGGVPSLPGKLGTFADIVAVDSTVVGLLDRLARAFPACRTNSRKAALKIHARLSLTRKDAERLRITSERTPDLHGTAFGAWVRDRLVLFDLGYFDYGLFAAIRRQGGTFLTRLKTTANGVILAVRDGCAARAVGTPLNQRIYTGRVVDLDAQLGRGATTVVARVVGIWDATAADYHWYVTSLAAADFSPDEVATLYGLRWQVELLFKEWKSVCHLTSLRTADPHLVQVLIYASLAFALLARLALAFACQRYGLEWHAMSQFRALKTLGVYAFALGERLVRRRRRGGSAALRLAFERLLETTAVYAPLPNRTNAILQAAGC